MAMITVEINNKDIDALMKRLSPEERDPKIRAGLLESAQYLVGEVQKGMTTHVDSGAARSSIVAGLRGHGTDLRGTVGSPLVHVFVMEHGRRPNQKPPPTAPIKLWLQRHGMDPKLAFVVARSIGRKGSFSGGMHQF